MSNFVYFSAKDDSTVRIMCTCSITGETRIEEATNVFEVLDFFKEHHIETTDDFMCSIDSFEDYPQARPIMTESLAVHRLYSDKEHNNNFILLNSI